MLFVESRSRKKPFGSRGRARCGWVTDPRPQKSRYGNRRLPACEAQGSPSAQRSTAPTASPAELL